MSLSGPFMFDPRGFFGDKDVRRMDFATIGVYLALLGFQWENGDIGQADTTGDIDVHELAVLISQGRASVSPDEFNKMFEQHFNKLFPLVRTSSGTSFRRNPRLAEERVDWMAKQDRLSARGRAAGKASAAARRGDVEAADRAGADSVDGPYLEQDVQHVVDNKSRNRTRNRNRKGTWTEDGNFAAAWKAYSVALGRWGSVPGDPAKAFARWETLPEVRKVDALRNLRELVDHLRRHDPAAVKILGLCHLSTWLNNQQSWAYRPQPSGNGRAAAKVDPSIRAGAPRETTPEEQAKLFAEAVSYARSCVAKLVARIPARFPGRKELLREVARVAKLGDQEIVYAPDLDNLERKIDRDVGQWRGSLPKTDPEFKQWNA